jgi:hypothetical protein
MKCAEFCEEQATHNVTVVTHDWDTDECKSVLLPMCDHHARKRAEHGYKVERINGGIDNE